MSNPGAARGRCLRPYTPARMSESTHWSLIEGAARGEPGERERFARCYEPIVRAYLGARWSRGPLRQDVDDAAQEVFAACFADEGPLGRADPDRGAFRAYLYGVVRNVARGFERRRRTGREVSADPGVEPGADEATLSQVYDRAWAQSLLREAVLLMSVRAVTASAQRRLEILRQRFEEGLPVRELARRLDMPVDRAHVAYARARREFKRAMRDVVVSATGVADQEADAECMRLIGFLG